jgi:hypothetical protein
VDERKPFLIKDIPKVVEQMMAEQKINRTQLAKRLGWRQKLLSDFMRFPERMTMHETADLFMALGYGAHIGIHKEEKPCTTSTTASSTRPKSDSGGAPRPPKPSSQ